MNIKLKKTEKLREDTLYLFRVKDKIILKVCKEHGNLTDIGNFVKNSSKLYDWSFEQNQYCQYDVEDLNLILRELKILCKK